MPFLQHLLAPGRYAGVVRFSISFYTEKEYILPMVQGGKETIVFFLHKG